MHPRDGEAASAVETVLRWRRERARAAGTMGLAELARHAGALADALAAHAAAAGSERGAPVACARGCAACCRHAVPLSAADACLLAETVEAMEWDRRAEVEEGFRRADASLAAAGLSDASLLDRADAYFSLRIPCPFLAGEACSVHATRPLACREHLAVSPGELCWESPGNSIRLAHPPVSAAEALAGIVGSLLGAREAVPLARWPRWMASSRDLAGMRWDGTRLLDLLAKACLARLR